MWLRVTGESDGILLAKREGRWARTLQRYIGNGGRNKMKGEERVRKF